VQREGAAVTETDCGSVEPAPGTRYLSATALGLRRVIARVRGNRALSKNALLTVAPIRPRNHHPVWNKTALLRTAISRAAEAIDAAEKMFADEVGATLDLSPAAKWP